jgi:hypothetical protein
LEVEVYSETMQAQELQQQEDYSEQLQQQGDYLELHQQDLFLDSPAHYSEEKIICLISQLLSKMVKIIKKVMMTMMIQILEKVITARLVIIQMLEVLTQPCPPI